MGTSAHSGPEDGVRVYIRDVVLDEPGVERALAERVADRLRRNLDRVIELYSEHAKGGRKASRKPATQPPAFDPYCFGAVVTLERDGREALLEKLETIEGIDELRVFAEAQHLVVDAGLRDAAAIRQSIAEAAAGRIADRRAASSG